MDKICPLLAIASNTNSPNCLCQKEKCQWWVVVEQRVQDLKHQEIMGCAIQAISKAQSKAEVQ